MLSSSRRFFPCLSNKDRVFQRGLIALVTYPLAVFFFDLHLRLDTGTMAVQIRIQVLAVEVVGGIGVVGVDVVVADVFAHNCAVLGFDKTIVAAFDVTAEAGRWRTASTGARILPSTTIRSAPALDTLLATWHTQKRNTVNLIRLTQENQRVTSRPVD